MDEAYEYLKIQGDNNLDGIIKWLKNKNLIDGKNVTEEKVRNTLGQISGELDLKQFKDCLKLLNLGPAVDSILQDILLENGYEKLKNETKNTVDNLIQWMKQSKIITSPELESKARKLFEDVTDQKNVEMEKFKEVVSKMTEDSKAQLQSLATTLLAEAPRYFNAFGAATSAFKEAFHKK